MIYRSHPFSRFVLAAAAIVMVFAGSKPVAFAVILMLVAWIDGTWLNIRRAMSALKWFIFPIILLHMLFASGERIWPETGLSLSLDGLKAGMVLSLVLATYYLLAMFVSRLWRQNEVFALAERLPFAGRLMYPFLVSLLAVRSAVRNDLEQFRQQFLLRRQWRHAGVLLTTILHRMFSLSTACSRVVWLRWPEKPVTIGRSWHLASNALVLTIASLLFAGGCFG